jgi:hypothetical protein
MRLNLCPVLAMAALLRDANPAQLKVEPVREPEHSVHVTAPQIGATWRLRFPERVLADPAILLVDHHDAPVTWTGTPAGGFSAAASASQIRFQADIEPAATGLALAFTIENRGSDTLRNVAGHICLSHDRAERKGNERFADTKWERSYIVSKGKLVNLNSIDRGGPPGGIRSHYLVAGAAPISFFPTQPFWGKLSQEHATEPWIAGTSVSGAWTVALWWEKATELFQNSDQSNRCIHSDPSFGDMKPGATVTVRGALDLVRGTPAEALRVYRRNRRNR